MSTKSSKGVGAMSTHARINEIDKKVDKEIVMEFGGPKGVTAMMLGFPILMYYLWACVEFYDGKLAHPSSLAPSDISSFFYEIITRTIVATTPTWYAVKIYVGYVIFSAILATITSGPMVKGLPIPSLQGGQLIYCCNGYGAFYNTVALSFVLHYFNIFPLSDIVDNFGPILTVSIATGFIVTFIVYFTTVWFSLMDKPHRMSHNFLYDLFMGAPLNPRLFGGRLDLKMWAEIRVPWVVLFYVSLSAAFKQYQLYGYVPAPMAFMLLAHWLYVNACMKGEECIPTTWDIFYEKFGFMLIFWNLAGVPFTYCLSTLYLLKQGPAVFEHQSTNYTIMCFTILIIAYYIWDTANSQRVRFRMKRAGTYQPRMAFPQLPWGTLENPRFIKTEHGNELLTDGWFRYARKMNYTADLFMALDWGLITGFNSFIPYFYFVFFIAVLIHRNIRDYERCAKKYGKDWDKYCKQVPYVFIPYIY